jgi:hypothetical protein
MNQLASLKGWAVFIYRFPVNNHLKNQHVDEFLNDLTTLCNYQLIDSFDNNPKLHQPNTVVLFLVTSLSDFEALRVINFPECVPKIVSYFFTLAEFAGINNTDYRQPFKARLFYLVYPDQPTTGGLIYASPIKVFDTIYVRTIRNKLCGTVLAHDIETYTQINPQAAIAEMREIGWYLRDKGLNHSDSFSGAIAIRFGNGMIINASKTDKYQIGSNHVCYVENYRPETNEIEYIGHSMPSSESLVANLIFQEFPAINLLLHFHHKTMTYSPKLDFYKTSKYVSYSIVEEAKTIVEKLRETNNFVIAYGHGEFCFTENFAEARIVISKVQNLTNPGDE